MLKRDDLLSLFPRNSQITALPNWRRPYLLIAGDKFVLRWSRSDFYPAYRLSAQPLKWMYRLRASVGYGKLHREVIASQVMENFIDNVLPGNKIGAILIKESAKDLKLIARIFDEHGNATSYLKYSSTDAGNKRLKKEHELLISMSEKLAPQVLAAGLLNDGYALLLKAVPGKSVPASLPPHPGITPLVRLIESREALQQYTNDAHHLLLPIEQHPWRQSLPHNILFVKNCIDKLKLRDWPQVLNHGDFAPWNILQHHSQCRAIDWEFADPQGFPYIDLIYFVLQTSLLIYRWSPAKTWQFSHRYLASITSLSNSEAESLICLVCYLTYERGQQEGKSDSHSAQQWRQAMWKYRP